MTGPEPEPPAPPAAAADPAPVQLRSVAAEDYPAIAAIHNAVHPDDRLSADLVAHLDAAFRPPYLFERRVAVRGGGVVGTASYAQHEGQYHPRRFYVEVMVAPEARRAGIGRQLWHDLLRQLEPHRAERLRAMVRESETTLRPKLAELGFVEERRSWSARLDLAHLDRAAFATRAAAARERIAAHGVDIVAYPDLPPGSDPPRTVFELFNRVRQDVPRTEPATPLSWDGFERRVFQAPDFVPEGLLLAVHDGTPIGLTQLWADGASNDLFTGLTGVLPAWRGRGIANALKAAAIELALGLGADRVFTDNDTANVEMVAINDRWGFVRDEALVMLRLDLPPGPSGDGGRPPLPVPEDLIVV